MNYTLDTAAIRKRFEQAIIGIRADGTMAVLVAGGEPIEKLGRYYFDLVSGRGSFESGFAHIFPTLIRPGDRCEVLGKDQKYHLAKYISVSAGDIHYPIIADVGNGPDGYRLIRPLPKEHLANRCTCVQYTNGRPSHVLDPLCPIHGKNSPLPAAETKTEAETGQHFNALEYWFTHGLKQEQEWDKIRQIFRNALGDNPGCPFCLSYISETEPNPLLTRLTVAEQELAAIRAEMEQVQK